MSKRIKIFPGNIDPRKISTAMCVSFFEDIEGALILLDSAKGEFNPIQRRLIGRFITFCKIFGLDMLAADGGRNALSEKMDLPIAEPSGSGPFHPPLGKSLVEDVCDGIHADLENIRDGVRGELLDGVAVVIEGIRAEQPEDSPALDAFDAISVSVRQSARQLDVIFDVLADIVQKTRAVNCSTGAAGTVGVDAFMKMVSPEKVEYRTDFLLPHRDDIEALVKQGYTWKQIRDFLEMNGVQAHLNAVHQFYHRVIKERG